MPKQTVTIEVECPPGYETTGAVEHSGGSWQNNVPLRLTYSVGLRPIWQPQPMTLKPGWIAMDRDGRWFWYPCEPKNDGGFYWSNPQLTGSQVLTDKKQVPLPHFDFTPPPCTDWRQSKRRIGGAVLNATAVG